MMIYRPPQVAGALPPLMRWLAHEWGLRQQELVLLGFSRGARMVLAMVAQGFHLDRTVAIAGPLAAPILPSEPAKRRLAHDDLDVVMPPVLSVEAASRLSVMGHVIARVRMHELGHAIGPTTLRATSVQL